LRTSVLKQLMTPTNKDQSAESQITNKPQSCTRQDVGKQEDPQAEEKLQKTCDPQKKRKTAYLYNRLHSRSMSYAIPAARVCKHQIESEWN
jgi:hypothetical protein